jgi:hypothetical protein
MAGCVRLHTHVYNYTCDCHAMPVDPKLPKMTTHCPHIGEEPISFILCISKREKADKSLARPGMKQPKATKHGIYSTYSTNVCYLLAFL